MRKTLSGRGSPWAETQRERAGRQLAVYGHWASPIAAHPLELSPTVLHTLTACRCTPQLDLASFDSIRKFADSFKALGRPVHILVNNAGVMMCPYDTTKVNGVKARDLRGSRTGKKSEVRRQDNEGEAVQIVLTRGFGSLSLLTFCTEGVFIQKGREMLMRDAYPFDLRISPTQHL